MSIYFDFKTINELTANNYYRQPKEFTQEELSQYNGSNGQPAYVAIEGTVYDISNSAAWGGGTHFGLIAGQDLTSEFNSCHGIMDILTNAPKVGMLKDEEYMGDMDNMDYTNDMNNMNYTNDMNNRNYMNNRNFQYNNHIRRQVMQDTSKFTPDEWIRYITPLVTYALREPSLGMNPQILYQRVILMGVLVGLGKTPQEAMDQVKDWQNTGASQILKSGTSVGGLGTTGSMGTGLSGAGTGTTGKTVTGIGGTSTGTTGKIDTGIGGTSTGTTGGTGTGIGGTSTGTTGGMGTAGSQGIGFGGTSTNGSTGARSSANIGDRLYLD